MRYSLSLFSAEHAQHCMEHVFDSGQFFDEVLLHTSTFSKAGQLSLHDAIAQSHALRQAGVRPVWVWDTLTDNTAFEQAAQQALQLPADVLQTVRFMDPGVGYFLRERFPRTQLQMTLERHSHNLTAICRWVDIFSKNLSRIVLSNEIPYPRLCEYRRYIPVEVEILGVGRLEIFNTPRQLLSPAPAAAAQSAGVKNQERSSALEATALQNQHGTLLFHEQDIFLLDVFPFEEVILEESEHPAVDWLRFDFYEKAHFELLQQLQMAHSTPGVADWQRLKQLWPKKSHSGYFRANKTDAQFKRLKNKYLQKTEQTIGEVLCALKGKYLVARFTRPVRLPAVLHFFSPEGKVFAHCTAEVQSLGGARIFTLPPPSGTADPGTPLLLTPGVYRLPWFKGALPKMRIECSPHSENNTP